MQLPSTEEGLLCPLPRDEQQRRTLIGAAVSSIAEISLARDLYGTAYEPVRETRSLEVLERQQSLLGAADALEKRARAIQEWPFDDGTFARVATIATSVTAAPIGRLILEPLGL